MATKTTAPRAGAKTMGTKTATSPKPAARATKSTSAAATNTKTRSAGAGAGKAATVYDKVRHRSVPAPGANAGTPAPKGGARSGGAKAKPAA